MTGFWSLGNLYTTLNVTGTSGRNLGEIKMANPNHQITGVRSWGKQTVLGPMTKPQMNTTYPSLPQSNPI